MTTPNRFDWVSARAEDVDHEYSPSQHSLRPIDEYLAEYHSLSSGHDAAALRVPRSPLLIYIHGGYWQKLSAADSLFNADDAIAEGVALHAVEYTLAPHASIAEIVEECIADVLDVLQELQPTRVVLAGCSAGAHLAAMCARNSEIAQQIDGLALLSGIYDLRPLVVTPTNEPLHLTEQSATELSPQLMSPIAHVTHALLAVGTAESSEFIRQNNAYADHLRSGGIEVDSMVVRDRDHFNLPYDLLHRDTLVGDWVLAQLSPEHS